MPSGMTRIADARHADDDSFADEVIAFAAGGDAEEAAQQLANGSRAG